VAAKSNPQDLSKSATERISRAKIDQLYSTVRLAIKWAGILGAAYIAKEAIIAFAGKSSSLLVQMAFSLFANLNFTVSITLTGCAKLWALRERRLRRRKVEQMQDRIRELETRIDPRRSSSGLLRDGKTNPADTERS